MAENLRLSPLLVVDSLTVDIVAVYGISGHSFRPWAANEASTCWLPDFLSNDIPEANLITFRHKLPVDDLTTWSISDQAEFLLQELAKTREEGPKAGRSIVFLGHCFGGLIIKEALRIAGSSHKDRFHQIFSLTTGIIFLSTPHSPRSDDLLKIINYHCAECSQFALGVEQLIAAENVQKHFRKLCLQGDFHIKITSFYEELPMPEIGVVTDKLAVTLGDTTILPLHANHRDICRINSSSDISYQQVLGELKRLVRPNIETPNIFNFHAPVILEYLHVDDGRESVGCAFRGTCNWIFTHTEYTAWIREENSSLLWIVGLAGSGKSILANHILGQFQAEFTKNPQKLGVCYFFNMDSMATNSIAVVFKSILYQVLSQAPNAMSDFVPLLTRGYSIPKDKILQLGRKGIELEDLLESTLTKTLGYHEIRMIIDGLDLCPASIATKLLSLYSRIRSKPTRNALKMCFSARSSEYVTSLCRIEEHRRIFVDIENREDLSKYISNRLQHYSGPLLRYSNYIQDVLMARSSGMFLWARLAIDFLLHRSSPVRTLNETLLLPDTNALYQAIFECYNRNSEASGVFCRRVWILIAFATRPLSVDEVLEALKLENFSTEPISCVTDHFSFATNESSRKSKFASKIDRNWVLAHFGWGLLEPRLIHPKGGNSYEHNEYALYFVHQSAKDFLQKTGFINDKFSSSPKGDMHSYAHLYIAVACSDYIYALQRDGRRTSTGSAQKSTSSSPLLHYCRGSWAEHAKFANQSKSSQAVLLQSLRWPSDHVIKDIMESPSRSPWDERILKHTPQNGSILHAAAFFGLPGLIAPLHDRDTAAREQIDVEDSDGRTPLSFAAERGHGSVVHALLKNGANLEARDKIYGLTPLSWAVVGGSDAVVRALLTAGANVEDAESGSTPLTIAARRGAVEVTSLLLQHGANPNFIDRHYGQTPLHLCSELGSFRVAMYLLLHGADPNRLDLFNGKTPLYYAIYGGWKNIVKLLLDFGASFPNKANKISREIPWTWADRIIDSIFGIHDEASSRGFENSGSHVRSRPTDCTAATRGSAGDDGNQSNRASRKRPRDCQGSSPGGDDYNNNSGHNPNKRPAFGPPSPSSNNVQNLNLACPYFKHDSVKYGQHRICRGPDGFPNVHRLKQHLYNVHFIRLCLRCGAMFNSDPDLECHMKATVACPSGSHTRNYADGFDENQKKQLKSRKMRKEFPNEEEYWKGVYRILFPNVDVVPSPFYDIDHINYDSYDASCARERAQDRHLRGYLLQIVRDATTVSNIIEAVNSRQSAIRERVLQSRSAEFTRAIASTTALQAPVIEARHATISQYQSAQHREDSFIQDSINGGSSFQFFSDYFLDSQTQGGESQNSYVNNSSSSGPVHFPGMTMTPSTSVTGTDFISQFQLPRGGMNHEGQSELNRFC